MSKTTVANKPSNVRQYILVTFSRADRDDRSLMEKSTIVERIRGCFDCITIIVSREEPRPDAIPGKVLTYPAHPLFERGVASSKSFKSIKSFSLSRCFS